MRSLRVVLLVLVSLVLGAVGAAPASAAKPQPATIRITSVVAVDTRSATVTWTPVKGTDHYVLEWAPAMRLSTSATTATITDLYPGEEVGFTVRAETKRNQVLATSSYAYVTLAPEGPSSLYGFAPSADTVRLWWGGGLGCSTYELAVAQPDASYTSVTQLPNYVDQSWLGYQEPSSTVSYAVRCANLSGLWSTWSEPFAVTTESF